MAECVDYFEQCCDVGSVLTSTPQPLIPPPQPGPQPGPGTSPPGTLPPGPGVLPPPTQPAQKKCGLRNAEGVGFRITGNSQGESEYGELNESFQIFK
jgi:hypothetical protein